MFVTIFILFALFVFCGLIAHLFTGLAGVAARLFGKSIDEDSFRERCFKVFLLLPFAVLVLGLAVWGAVRLIQEYGRQGGLMVLLAAAAGFAGWLLGKGIQANRKKIDGSRAGKEIM